MSIHSHCGRTNSTNNIDIGESYQPGKQTNYLVLRSRAILKSKPMYTCIRAPRDREEHASSQAMCTACTVRVATGAGRTGLGGRRRCCVGRRRRSEVARSRGTCREPNGGNHTCSGDCSRGDATSSRQSRRRRQRSASLHGAVNDAEYTTDIAVVTVDRHCEQLMSEGRAAVNTCSHETT